MFSLSNLYNLGSYRLTDLHGLIASPNDPLALIVFEVRDVLVLPLYTLPDLYLAATMNNTHSHRRKQVMCGIGMHVNASVEPRQVSISLVVNRPNRKLA